MSNRFTRNIQNVGDIQNLPLYTNDQNDLISTDSMVYVRHNNAYEPILNKGVLGTGLTPEDVDRINGLIDDKFKGYTEGAIKELNNDEITELEQSILNLIGDRLGGLKFDQDGFKTSLNEVLKRLELSEIADVQNLQREIEYIFDENNKSTSKKIDEVKSELSQMIDERVQSQSTPVENDNPILDTLDYINLDENNRITLDKDIYTDKEISAEDLKLYELNYGDVLQTITGVKSDNLEYDENTLYSYNLKLNMIDYSSNVLLTYKDKPIELNNYQQEYITKKEIENSGMLRNNLNDEIEQLKQRIEKLENN
mgnify:FL=1